MRVLVTGSAGFIGYHTSVFLCNKGYDVIGVDNLNDYYSVKLKKDRLNSLNKYRNFKFQKIDICNKQILSNLFSEKKINKVIHLAAQAGVRYSIENPDVYIDSNIVGFFNIIEQSIRHQIEHFVFASSSSVYGANEKIPFDVSDNVDHPLSLYAATKKSNELISHSYSHLYGLPVTGLRFFTVYGPWGRPDMSPFIFADAIMNGNILKIFNFGKHKRDFTYIDDVVSGILGVLDNAPSANLSWSGTDPDPASSRAPWRIFNIGNSKPIELMYYVELLENEIGKKANLEFLPMQPGDVYETYADVSSLTSAIGYLPKVSIEEGTKRFVSWFKDYIETRNEI